MSHWNSQVVEDKSQYPASRDTCDTYALSCWRYVIFFHVKTATSYTYVKSLCFTMLIHHVEVTWQIPVKPVTCCTSHSFALCLLHDLLL